MPSLVEISPVVLKKNLSKCFQCISNISLLTLIRRYRGPSFEQTWIPFTHGQGCFVPSLVETGPVVLEKMGIWSLQTDRRTDGHADWRWTAGDQKSSTSKCIQFKEEDLYWCKFLKCQPLSKWFHSHIRRGWWWPRGTYLTYASYHDHPKHIDLQLARQTMHVRCIFQSSWTGCRRHIDSHPAMTLRYHLR